MQHLNKPSTHLQIHHMELLSALIGRGPQHISALWSPGSLQCSHALAVLQVGSAPAFCLNPNSFNESEGQKSLGHVAIEQVNFFPSGNIGIYKGTSYKI